MTAFTFAVLAIAAYRAARALSLDSITEPLRDWFDDRAGRSRWWEKSAELISCGFCSGFWLSGITYAVWLSATHQWGEQPWLIHGIMWWSIAGVQSMLIAVDSFLLREAPPH